MSCSSADASCTSAAANDRVWHVRAARRRVDKRARNSEVRLHAWLVVVRSDILLHLQLHPVATRSEVRRTEGALQTERPPRQTGWPVAVNVHVARKERPMVAPDRDHEHWLRQI